MSGQKKYGWLQTVLFLATGVGFFYFVAQKFDLIASIQIIKRGIYYNAIPVALISFMSYWFRVQRWRLLMKAGGYPASFGNGLLALSIGYTVNYALPRFGEVTRSFIVKRSEGTPFELTLGAVVMERLVDIMALFVVCVVVLLLQFQLLLGFIQLEILSPLSAKLSEYPSTWGLWIVVFIVMVGLFFSFRKARQAAKLNHVFHSFIKGLLSIKKIEQGWLFVLYTTGIWACYFSMTYLWTFSFPESACIGPLAAFVVMVLGTIGRSLPVQGGGMGVYHSIVTPAFMLYGVNEQVAFALAIIIHGAQAVFSCIMGLISYMWMTIVAVNQKLG